MRPQDLQKALVAALTAREPILLKGPPGVGKTDIVLDAAEEAGMEALVGHPVVDDPVDYKGIPYAHDGEANFLPFGNLKRLVETDSPTVYFFDDLGQAPQAVQAAAMQLILARTINEHLISDQVTFVAATNRKEDKAGVSGILEPVKSRFTSILEFEVNKDDWIAWAMENDMPTALIGFIEFRPNLLHDFEPSASITNTPCPRTVANVGRIVQMGLTDSLRHEMIAGAAGQGFAAEFEAFLEVYEKLPDPKKALEDPSSTKVDDRVELSTKYAFVTALAEYVTADTADNFFELLRRFSDEFGVLAVRLAITRNRDLQRQQSFTDWLVEKQHVLI